MKHLHILVACRSYCPVLRSLEIALLLSLFFFSCHHSTEPVVKVDPRAFKWSADTIYYPQSFQTIIYRVWGSSPSNVWGVGYCSEGTGQMWHFDGTKWTVVHIITGFGGTITGLIGLTSIYGFSPNDIWAVGDRLVSQTNGTGFTSMGIVIHFDGISWTQSLLGGPSLNYIWGTASNDVWASGSNGTVLHFDGASWARSTIDTSFAVTSVTGHVPGSLFAGGVSQIPTPLGELEQRIWHYDGVRWVTRDSSFILSGPAAPFGGDLKYAWGTLYGCGLGGIYTLTSGSWSRLFAAPAGGPAGFDGSSSANIIAIGPGPNIYHYNGSDWYTYPAMLDNSYYPAAVWVTQDEAFVVGEKGTSFAVVLHGK